MELDARQLEAVKLCLHSPHRIVAVTGAAGTGKTTIIKHVTDMLDSKRKSYSIAAPTGKAARRITQATGKKASTVHKLLEYPRPGEVDSETGQPKDPGQPKRCKKFPLSASTIIIDEYAMMNTELDRNVIDALGRGARLLCFGDVNQLPPIEPYKLTGIETTPFERHLKRCSIELEHVYRQEEGGGILEAADRIRNGTMPRRHKDFEYQFTEKPVDFILTRVSPNYKEIDRQIIVPTKKGWVGTRALNRALRDKLNPSASLFEELELPRNSHDEDPDHPMLISIGDKVVCTENTYDMRPYQMRYAEFNSKGHGLESSFLETPDTKLMLNGETGVVIAIYPDGSFHVDMGDRTVEIPAQYTEYNFRKGNFYDVDPRKRIDLAYALTTHKCQGSEYEEIIYLINRSNAWMLNRKNTYTAITRAKTRVLLVCDQRALQMALRPEIRS